jgi:uncharacterized protein (TIGR03083 family)
MPTLADRTIAALSDEHTTLTSVARSLTDEQLTGPSGASEWTVADVLSHLGSGAVITLAGLRAALGDGPTPADDFNPSVWDRWNALSPTEQRDNFLEHDAALVLAFEEFSADQRESLDLPVGFAPAPLSVAGFVGLRLNEVAAHSWDVRVAVDPTADLRITTAAALADLLAGELGFLLGFIGKADTLTEPALVQIAETDYGISITDSVALVTPVAQPTATFAGSLELALRLLTGRLTAAHTPGYVTVSGNVDLDDLRRVFPGF